MKLIDDMDFVTLLWMQMQPQWANAVSKCTYSGLQDGIRVEGLSGYISVKVELEIRNISMYADLWENSWDDEVRNELKELRRKVLG